MFGTPAKARLRHVSAPTLSRTGFEKSVVVLAGGSPLVIVVKPLIVGELRAAANAPAYTLESAEPIRLGAITDDRAASEIADQRDLGDVVRREVNLPEKPLSFRS